MEEGPKEEGLVHLKKRRINMDDLMDAIAYVFQHVKDSQKIEDKVFVSPTGRIFTKEFLHELEDDPIPDPIESQSLMALVEYVVYNADELEPHTTIYIVSPTEVIVHGRPRATDSKRRVYFRATQKMPPGTKSSKPMQYWTFPEIEQPLTPLKQDPPGEESLSSELTLFSTWRLAAIRGIKDYLKLELDLNNAEEALQNAGVKISIIG